MVKRLNKAIILAAGQGSRLKHILKGKPKPLLRIGKTTLLENLIKNLNSLNIKKIVIVVGYKSKIIKKKIKNKVKFIFYPDFKLKNNLHTMLYIKKELNEPKGEILNNSLILIVSIFLNLGAGLLVNKIGTSATESKIETRINGS